MKSASQIASDVRSGAVKARDVLEECLAQIDARETEIHAFNLVLADEARAAADALDASDDKGPLAGVPIALKDNMCTQGIPTTCSSRILDGWRPPYDATVVERIRAAGGIVVGKTNLDEFAMGSSTENSAFGPTRNPHDVSRVPGGSSGGSAAAVAASFASLSIGSDTGGSIRQPAALCGVVGVKPTYGLVSRYGLVAFASSLDQIGPFANSVDDAALFLDTIWGHDPRDSTSIPGERPALDTGADVSGLRVGLIEEMIDGEGFDPAVRAAVSATAEGLAAAGAKVDTVSLPSTKYGISAYYLIAPAEASSNLARYDGVRYGLHVDAPDVAQMNAATREAGFGPEVKRRIMLGTYALSAGYYDAYYGQAQRVRTLIIRDFERAYENFDVLLSPTAPTTAFEIGAKADDPLAMYLCDVCTVPVNLTGHAAMSVPFGADDAGLPIGVQVFAPALGEGVMFRVARRDRGERTRVVTEGEWESEAENWVRWARTPDFDAYWHYRDEFFDTVVPPAGRRSLDIGCGEGRATRDLVARGHRVAAIDSATALVRAARDVDAASAYVRADGAALPFADGAFDLAIAYNSLQVVGDMAATVAESGRVLEPGGRFCVCVAHPASDLAKFTDDGALKVRSTYFVTERVDDVVRRGDIEMRFLGWTYSLEHYSRALESAGFHIETMREPKPSGSDAEYDRWRSVPLFLQMRAVKA